MSAIIINYTVDGITPLKPITYVLPAATNPATIVAGESATLNFAADGIYFTILPLKAKVLVENATLSSWTCKTPFTSATAVITGVVDPEADVIITIPVKVKTAPQQVTKPFLVQASVPIDTRLVLTKKEMKEANDTYLPDAYFALCKDEGHFYMYNKNAIPNEETGKYVLITDIVEYNIKAIDGGEII